MSRCTTQYINTMTIHSQILFIVRFLQVLRWGFFPVRLYDTTFCLYKRAKYYEMALFTS